MPEPTERPPGEPAPGEPAPGKPAPGEPAPAALPARPPRSIAVHFGVDAAVAFLVVILVALMFGFGVVETAVVALVIGAVAAPFTRRAEARALTARGERAAGGEAAPEGPTT